MTSAKYPRSFHLPWSPGGTRADKRLADVSALTGVEIVVTEKIDGSNLTYTRESVFARTHSAPPNHPSFNLAKATHARIRAAVPEGLSVFCEYCFAVHSIEYGALPDYSIVIGVRDDDADLWLNWTAVEQTAAALGLPAAPVLFRGVVESATTLERLTIQLASGSSVFGGAREGLVARAAAEFHSAAFHRMVGKYVRAGHVQTDEHWTVQTIRQQRLAPAQV